ncbi:MAG TPA: WecB/TagA/CpsF family glycosyltransferase [Opitutaceae bacterium]|nr:WecB/TagA/CpsF family glycosyltransferase [Opitutaceae bacterium]
MVAPPLTGNSTPPRYNVLGVGVSALTLPQARDLILGAKGGPQHGYVCCGTAHGLVEARTDPKLRRIYNESWLTTPDGMPLVWLGPKGVGRVYGPDLMLAVCDAGRSIGLRHYLFGGRPGVAPLLAENLLRRFPGVDIVGTMTPPFGAVEELGVEALRADVIRTQPDVIWVGLGSPKQEHFMAAHCEELDVGVLIGVGAAFDFHSGRVRQAPSWIRGSGFEWLFRVCMEPRRLGWRYLRGNPLFIAHLVAQKLGSRRYELGRGSTD